MIPSYYKKTSGSNGIQNITNTGGNLTITGDTVATNIDLNVNTKKRIGASVPFIYEYRPSILNGSQIGSNATIINSVSTLSIGWLPINRSLDIGSAQYVKNILENLETSFPFKIKMVNSNNTGEYVTFNITSLNGAGADYKLYSASHIASETTITNFWAIGTLMQVYFLNNTSLQMQDLTNTNFAGIIAGDYIVYDGTNFVLANPPVNTDGRIDINYSTDLINPTLNLNAEKILLESKNTYDKATVKVLKRTFEKLNSVTFNSFGSMTIKFDGTTAFDQSTIFYPTYPIINPKYKNGVQNNLYFAVRLDGALWNTATSDAFFMGWGTAEAYTNVDSWAHTDVNLAVDGVWNTTNGQKTILMQHIGLQAHVTRGGAVTNMPLNATSLSDSLSTGDIFVTVFRQDLGPGYTNIDFMWRKAGNLTVNNMAAWTTVSTNKLNEIETAPIIPVFNSSKRIVSDDYRVTFLSERECISLGLQNGPYQVAPNAECVFY